MITAFAVSAGMVAGLATPARPWAQESSDLNDGVVGKLPVFSRPNPDYDSLGVRLGAFDLYPSLALTEQYDTNLYALSTNAIGDFGTVISPRLSLQSDWSQNLLRLSGSADILRQSRRVSENVTNTQTSLAARWDFMDDSAIQSTTGYQIQHEARGSPDAVNGKTPTRYDLTTEQLTYSHIASDVGWKLDATVNDYRFFNVEGNSGGIINQSYRSRTEYNFAPTLSYEVTPSYQLFGTVAGNVRDYGSRRDPSGFDRNASGYLATIGSTVDLSGVLSGNLYAGYQSEFYRDTRLATASGVAFGSNLLWSPTRITSVTLKAARIVTETTVQNASSALETDLGIDVQHELRRNLLVRTGLAYSHLDYQGIKATDNLYEFSAELRYLINPYASAAITGKYQRRPGGDLTTGFDRGIVGLQVTGQF